MSTKQIGIIAAIVVLLVAALLIFGRRREKGEEPGSSPAPAVSPASPSPAVSPSPEGGLTPSPQPSPTPSPRLSPSPTPVTVNISASGFSPSSLNVSVGGSAVFVNSDTTAHWPASDPHPTHVLCPELNSQGALQPGASYTAKFSGVKVCTFHDHLNPSLKGTVTVR